MLSSGWAICLVLLERRQWDLSHCGSGAESLQPAALFSHVLPPPPCITVVFAMNPYMHVHVCACVLVHGSIPEVNEAGSLTESGAH